VTTFVPRPDQEPILDYTEGRLAIPAVPGAGKSTTLAHLAARLLPRLQRGQKLLLLTYQRSAAGSLAAIIRQALAEHGQSRLWRHCEIRTIHSFCRAVVVENAQSLGFANAPEVISEPEAEQVLRRVAVQWLDLNLGIWRRFIEEERSQDRWKKDILDFLPGAIQAAKALRLSETAVVPQEWLLAIVVPVFRLYQRELMLMEVVDYSDLVSMAQRAIETGTTIRQRLHDKYLYLLEDEAQDSYVLQTRLLDLIAGPDGNLVRVGDVNQSILSTFTNADPREFRRFIHDAPSLPLTMASRSASEIMGLANDLVSWTVTEHPVPEVRQAFEDQEIHEVPGQNPDPIAPVRSLKSRQSESTEWSEVAKKAADMAKEHPDLTVGILVPDNAAGRTVVGQLRHAHQHEPDNQLRQSDQATIVPKKFQRVFQFVLHPDQKGKLWDCLGLLAGDGKEGEARVAAWKRGLGDFAPERLLFEDALPATPNLAEDEQAALVRALAACSQWLSSLLRPDELVEVVAHDLGLRDAALATAHKLAAQLRRLVDQAGAWTRADAAALIDSMLDPRGSFFAVEAQSLGFRPRPGIVTVITYWRAKGLEWDVVYLTGLNDYHFPSEPEQALRMRNTLGEPMAYLPLIQAEVEAVVQGGRVHTDTVHRNAQIASLQERLRLLYVGITRAKRQLNLSWSQEVGAYGEPTVARLCLPLDVLINRKLAARA